MGVDVGHEAGGATVFFDQILNSADVHGGEAAGRGGFNEGWLFGGNGFGELFFTFEEVVEDGVVCDILEGEDAFFGAFAGDDDGAAFEVDVFHAEGREFADAQACAVEEEEDGPVEEVVFVCGVRGAEELADFVLGEGGRGLFREAREAQFVGGVVFDFAFLIEESEH